jgi:hypothetical protein
VIALACPVCFGQSDSPMAWAVNLSIIVMLLVVGGVLAGFASFIFYLMRRARLTEEQHLAQGTGQVAKMERSADASRLGTVSQ